MAVGLSVMSPTVRPGPLAAIGVAHRSVWANYGVGNAAVTIVPPADDAISDSPRTRATRSRMPIRPRPSVGVPRIEAAAIVVYAYVEHAADRGNGDLDVTSVGVADSVGERLLDDAEQRGFQPRRVAHPGQADVHAHRDAGALGGL